MKILAIDPGLSCGWALRDGETILGGTWDLRPRRHEGGGMIGVHLRRFLREIGPVDLVGYEEVRRHLGTSAAHVYGGITGVLTAYCEENETPYEAVPVATIKKHATGKGNADKEAMMASCLERLSIAVESSDEADARWLLDYLSEREGLSSSRKAMGRSR